MKGLKRLNKEYFERFKEIPVEVKPFNPKSKSAAKKYMEKLDQMFSKFNLKSLHRGSTAFGIAGKGEIEIGLYIPKEIWFKVLIEFINYYKKIGNLEKDYARFNDKFDEFDIEIILMTGYQAKVDKQLHKYLETHLEILKQYEELKRKYSYSKKEYKIQQHKFFCKIIKNLPEN